MDLEELPEPPKEVPDVHASPERGQPTKEQVSGDPIVESSDGLTALLVRSDRPAESQQKDNAETEELEDELDLPSVPTAKVRSKASEKSKSDSKVPELA